MNSRNIYNFKLLKLIYFRILKNHFNHFLCYYNYISVLTGCEYVLIIIYFQNL